MSTITDHELRAMIREAIARHTHHPARMPEPDPAIEFSRHASHVRLKLARGTDGDGACLIEPTVECAHCGFCQSFGH